MSLTSFLKDPEVLARLAPLRPALPRKLAVPLLVEPRTRRWTLVGTAFDYLLRFEVQRRADRVAGRHWVAELAPEMLREAAAGELDLEVVTDGPPVFLPPPGGFKRAAGRVQKTLDEARFAVADYVIAEAPPAGSLPALAAHALRLARLDLVLRAGIFDTRFAEAAPADVEDLLAMLALVPFETLLPERHGRVILNPVFGEASDVVGGADADVIVGDLLVDIKTSKEPRVRTEHLDQLLGYLFLARRAHRQERRFPRVRRLGLYFARRAHLCVLDAAEWTGHPRFRETEGWFFQRAEEVFGGAELVVEDKPKA